MEYIPDNYEMWKQHEWEKERRLKRLPICRECGEHNQSDYAYQFEGKYICPDCVEFHRVEVEEEW